MTSGNYIHDLQMAVREQAAALEHIQHLTDELFFYLCSPKFDHDTTVQVRDVINRIAPIKSATICVVENPFLRKLTRPVVATGDIVLE